MPHEAVGLRFCRSVLASGEGDIVALTLHQADGSRTLYQEDPTTISSWRCFDVDLDSAEQGITSTLEISVFDDGDPTAARVGVDDISLLVGIFFDGFESGDTSRWTSAHP
jgi:hypothetical protein